MWVAFGSSTSSDFDGATEVAVVSMFEPGRYDPGTSPQHYGVSRRLLLTLAVVLASVFQSLGWEDPVDFSDFFKFDERFR